MSIDHNRDDPEVSEERSGYSSVYSDAYYRAAPDGRRSCYGYSPAQCYARVSVPDPENGAGTKRTQIWETAALTFAVILLVVSAFAVGSMFLSRTADAGSEEPSFEERGLYEEYSVTAESETEPTIALNRGDAAEKELPATEIYTRACAFTVGVTIPGHAYNIFGQPGENAVTGTGIVLSEDGYILTNYHVIETAYEQGTPILILTYNEEEYEAEVIGIESDSDLAVLKIEAEGLEAAVLGDSDGICVGQTIYTVGNPLGELTYTMTSGIISATGRRITTDEAVIMNMFQVDAAINNGNSGGPVFNTSGQVIGVVTAKFSQYGMEGLGFAIPINDACRIACDLADKGYVSGKAYLGMSIANVSPVVAKYYDMVQGVYICSVEEDSCSEKAGLMPGDIILSVDGKDVRTVSELTRAVREYRAGDSAGLTVWRDGDELAVTVVFDEELPAERVEQESGSVHPSAEPDVLES